MPSSIGLQKWTDEAQAQLFLTLGLSLGDFPSFSCELAYKYGVKPNEVIIAIVNNAVSKGQERDVAVINNAMSLRIKNMMDNISNMTQAQLNLMNYARQNGMEVLSLESARNGLEIN